VSNASTILPISASQTVSSYEALARRIFNQHFCDRSQIQPHQHASSLASAAKDYQHITYPETRTQDLTLAKQFC
jgi:hypothetical protein